jgi:hypothetical protein
MRLATRLASFALAAALAALASGPFLTTEESQAGWRLLFDGVTRAGWTGMKGTPFPARSWAIENGMLRTLEDAADGDLVTAREYTNFELVFDYRIEKGGNSGVKYLVRHEWLSPHWAPDAQPEFRRRQAISAVGYEFQVFDDDTLDRKPGWELSSTGALYLLEEPKNKRMNPPGEWNAARIVVRDGRVEHWLNGGKLLEYELGSKELLSKVETTKFRKVPGYGRRGSGHIVLQHHDSPAWFRNIKIRELP